MWNPDNGAAKLAAPLTNPPNYFEMTFTAQAGIPYRLWVRGKADNNSPYNDSFFVQFSGSVTSSGYSTFRIGTNSATVVNLEDCSGCGLSSWGWQDNGWGVGVLGEFIYFQTSGTQTLRIQAREDGFSLDQIVLSSQTYRYTTPGALKNDSTILPASTTPPTSAPAPIITSVTPNSGTTAGGTSVTINGSNFVSGATVTFGGAPATNVTVSSSSTITATTPSRSAATIGVTVVNPDTQSGTIANSFTYVEPLAASEIVLYAAQATARAGNFSAVADSTAAGGSRMWNPDYGGIKLTEPVPSPSSYFEMTFTAQAGIPYRLWVRGKADNNSPYNDSFFVQFSGSVTSSGLPTFRIGTNSGTTVNLEDCSGCGLSGWGWQDNGWGVGVLGSYIYFQSSGPQTLRIQAREDGFSLDQIVLSPQTYIILSPGATRNDTTILASTGGGAPPPPPVNQPPQVSISASVTSGTAPLSVSFFSNASDPDGYISSYSWNFGNGQTSTQVSPVTTYSSAGTYTAQLTVTDNNGATSSATIQITVNNPPSSPPPTSNVTLRIVTWNVAFGRGTDNIANLDRQATYLANQSPDVIGLCEVDINAGNMPQTLTNLMTQKTGVTWRSHFVPKYEGCPEGNLILTKWQVVSTSYGYLSYQRSVAQMTINVNGKVINFFATHLDASYSSYRYTEVGELVSFMSGFAEPRFVVGDFNAGPDLSEISQMVSSYYDAWEVARQAGTATAYPDNPVVWMTRTRRGRIDYIFHSNGASNVTLTGASIPDIRNLSQTPVITLGTLDDRGVRPSDHNLVVSTYQIR